MEIILVAFVVLMTIAILNLVRKIRQKAKVRKQLDRTVAIVSREERTVSALQVIYGTKPKDFKKSKAGHDITKLNFKQLYFVQDLYKQYYALRQDIKNDPITVYATNHIGETFGLTVTDKQSLADTLNTIFDLAKSEKTYSRIYSQRD